MASAEPASSGAPPSFFLTVGDRVAAHDGGPLALQHYKVKAVGQREFLDALFKPELGGARLHARQQELACGGRAVA